MKIPLIKSYLPESTRQRVLEVIDSGWLTEGPVTREFETAVAGYVGVDHAFAVCNCTVGLEVALRCLGIGPSDEVIVPDFTYPASASAVNIVGATAVLVDCDPDTLLVDYDALEAAITPATKAIMPVSVLGQPLDYDRLAEIKRRTGLYLIEDAACSLGASYKGTQTGSFADISVFSFHPRKFITTGEGGVIVTNNPQWADWIDRYKHFGMTPGKMEFSDVGTNYKLSNILAALGAEQMKVIDTLLARRLALGARYRRLLEVDPAIRFPTTVEGGRASYQSFCIFVEERDNLRDTLRAEGIEVQIGTFALSREPAYQPRSGCRWGSDFDGSHKAYTQTLVLPLFHEMTEEEQNHVVHRLLHHVKGGITV